MLQLTLTQEAAKTLEDLTRRNVGKNVAIIIGQQVVSTHTIREPIPGGELKISRCSDDACRYILAKLQE